MDEDLILELLLSAARGEGPPVTGPNRAAEAEFLRRAAALHEATGAGFPSLEQIQFSPSRRLEGGGTAFAGARLSPEARGEFDDPGVVDMLLGELLSQSQEGERTGRESVAVQQMAEERGRRAEAERTFLQRLFTEGLVEEAVGVAQDFQRDPLSFTAVGDVREGNEALSEGRVGTGLFLTALAAAGAGGLVERILARRAARRGARESGKIVQDRRSGGDRRRAPREEGPGGRRASDPQADSIFSAAERVVMQDIFGQARRAADAPSASTVDPIAELLRIIQQGEGN